jgi:hypothetical protein
MDKQQPVPVPYKVVGAVFSSGGNKPYFYRTPIDQPVELGDRVVVKNKSSFSIPTVVGIYEAGGLNDQEANDWLVCVIDVKKYEELVASDFKILKGVSDAN